MEDEVVQEVSGKPWEKYRNNVQPKQETAPKAAPWEKYKTMLIDRPVAAVQEFTDDLKFDNVFNKLVGAESRGQHYGSDGQLLTSPAGAEGITQVTRPTGQDPGYGVTPLRDQSEEEYLRFGKDYLKAMLDEYGGDYRLAVAAYNAGPGNVNAAIKAAKASGGDFTVHLPKRSETIPYLDKILGTKEGL